MGCATELGSTLLHHQWVKTVSTADNGQTPLPRHQKKKEKKVISDISDLRSTRECRGTCSHQHPPGAGSGPADFFTAGITDLLPHYRCHGAVGICGSSSRNNTQTEASSAQRKRRRTTSASVCSHFRSRTVLQMDLYLFVHSG